MSGGEPEPTHQEIGKAGLVAAAAAALSVPMALALLIPREFAGLVVAFLLFGLPIALLHAFMLGLPLYTRLRRHWPLRWWSAALGGFLVGLTPNALLSLPRVLGGPLGEDLCILVAILSPGFPGLVGGLTFWVMLRRSGSCR